MRDRLAVVAHEHHSRALGGGSARRTGELAGPVVYCAEGATPVAIDHERLDVRVHQTRLLPDAMDAEVRHDPDRLALAVHDVGAEVQRLAR